tara:strand:- start:592 stop:1212 length:621 start_codon:yes stop_codon:yes gene_type:complete
MDNSSNGVQEFNKVSFTPTSPQGNSSSLSTIESGGKPMSNNDLEKDLNIINGFSVGNKIKEPENENCKVCCVGGSICLFTTGILGAAVTYVVFCIISLCQVSLKTTQNRCPGSTLWIYLLVSLLINGGAAKNSKQEKETLPCALVCNILIVGGFASWGTYELWGRPDSENLENLLLYTMCSVQVIMSWVMIGAFIAVIIGVIGFSK